MLKRIFLFSILLVLILPVYSKKDILVKKWECYALTKQLNIKEKCACPAIAKAGKKEMKSSGVDEISFSAPIGQYLTSFE